MMAESLTYDGQQLVWRHADGTQDVYKATSGLIYEDAAGAIHDHRQAADQCRKDEGPIPEGKYVLKVKLDPRTYARDDGSGQCNLRPSDLIQRIPRGGAARLPPAGSQANGCEDYWANWGANRIRVEAADAKTRQACTPRRGSFYLHDSTKGYTHGCIEVEGRFFTKLRRFAQSRKVTLLYLTVAYAHASTYGGTYIPAPAAGP
jgi:hypothetical protein